MFDERSSNTTSVVMLHTAPDEATAQDLAAKVLAEKLAACVILILGAIPPYYWEGKLEREYKVQMILKTTVSHQQALLECLKSHHLYQIPEPLALPVTYGDADYLSWLSTSLRWSCYFAAFPFLPDYSTRRDVHNLSPRIKSLLLIFSKTNMT